MRERFIPAIVMLLAGAVTSIINIINKVEVVAGLERLLIVLIVFYMIGLIAKSVITNMIIHAPKEKAEDEAEEPDQENEPGEAQPEVKKK